MANDMDSLDIRAFVDSRWPSIGISKRFSPVNTTGLDVAVGRVVGSLATVAVGRMVGRAGADVAVGTTTALTVART